MRTAQLMSLLRQYVVGPEAAWQSRTDRLAHATGVSGLGAGQPYGMYNLALLDTTLTYAMLRALGTGRADPLDLDIVNANGFVCLDRLHRTETITTQAVKEQLFKLACRKKGGGVPQGVADCLWANHASDGVHEMLGCGAALRCALPHVAPCGDAAHASLHPFRFALRGD
jgi:hypothetical protein